MSRTESNKSCWAHVPFFDCSKHFMNTKDSSWEITQTLSAPFITSIGFAISIKFWLFKTTHNTSEGYMQTKLCLQRKNKQVTETTMKVLCAQTKLWNNCMKNIEPSIHLFDSSVWNCCFVLLCCEYVFISLRMFCCLMFPSCGQD